MIPKTLLRDVEFLLNQLALINTEIETANIDWCKAEANTLLIKINDMKEYLNGSE